MGFVVVGLGEALFDLLPERQVLGGAPLNVAVHAAQLARALSVGSNPDMRSPLQPFRSVMASRVGQDPLGNEVAEALAKFGVDTTQLQRDPLHPTGVVRVSLKDGEPTYDIVTESAWDYLAWDEGWAQLAKAASAVCFGSLAQRSAISRATIQRFLREANGAWRLFDVNLRPPFIDHEVIRTSCQLANLLKCNEDELPLLADLFQVPYDGSTVLEVASQVRTRLGLRALMLTRGALGCTLLDESGIYVGKEVRFERSADADTIGAGDATSAALLLGVLLGWSPQASVDLANHVGAYVASQCGATPTIHSI